jgi:acetyltransferase-like isoleucine patch superfamily enzyme
MIITFFKNLYLKYKSIKLTRNKFLTISESSILLNGTLVRFDSNKEKRKYIVIGERCLLNCEFVFESEKGLIKIGNNVNIGGARLISRESIIIGNDVTMAWGITIYDHNSHSLEWDFRKFDNSQCYNDYIKHNNKVFNKNWQNVLSSGIVICDKVWVGFDVTILKGVTIGEGAIIGAKSVVTKNIPPWSVAAGNPAKVIKYLK